MVTGHIYKLYNTINTKYYIGSTIQKYVSNRFSTHLRDAKIGKRPDYILHKVILEIGSEKWKIETLKTIEVSGRKELTKIEDLYIDISDPNCLNSKRACGIRKEDYSSKKDYEKARYVCSKKVDAERAKTRWQKLKNDPIKYEEYKQKKRVYDKNWRRCANKA